MSYKYSDDVLTLVTRIEQAEGKPYCDVRYAFLHEKESESKYIYFHCAFSVYIFLRTKYGKDWYEVTNTQASRYHDLMVLSAYASYEDYSDKEWAILLRWCDALHLLDSLSCVSKNILGIPGQMVPHYATLGYM